MPTNYSEKILPQILNEERIVKLKEKVIPDKFDIKIGSKTFSYNTEDLIFKLTEPATKIEA